MENVITVSYKKEGEIAYQLFQYDEGIKIRVEDIPQEDGIVYSLEAVNVGDKRAEKLQEEEPGLWLINDELLSTGRDMVRLLMNGNTEAGIRLRTGMYIWMKWAN